MITTLDGIKAKRGEFVWEIGITVGGVYKPTRSKVHGYSNRVINESRCWWSYDLCKKECDKKNSFQK